MDLDPSAPDPPLLPHPFPAVGNIDPGAIDSNDNIALEDRWIDPKGEIKTFDPAEKGRIIR